MKKFNGINFIKFIMSLFVVAIHLQPLIKYSSSLIINIFNSISLCAVPFFYLVTGFFLGKKLKDCSNEEKMNILKFERRKILKLYIVYTIIYLPLTFFDYFTNNQSIIYNVFHFFRGLFLIGEHYNSWILWYLLAEYYSLVLLSITTKFKFNNKNNCLIGIALYSISIIVYYINKYNDSFILFSYLNKIFSLIIGNGRLFTCFIFLILGINFNIKGKKTGNIKYVLLLILFFILNVFINNYLISCLLCIGCSYLIFILSLSINIFNQKICDFLRFFSEKLYFWHLYIWSFICIFIVKDVLYGLLVYLIVIFVCLIISLIWYFLKNKKNKMGFF